MKKYIGLTVLVVFLIAIFAIDLQSQCPMCRMSAESNLQDGGTAGKGLNKGILYMLSMPYLLVGTLGYLWWRNRRRVSDDIFSEPFSDN